MVTWSRFEKVSALAFKGSRTTAKEEKGGGQASRGKKRVERKAIRQASECKRETKALGTVRREGSSTDLRDMGMQANVASHHTTNLLAGHGGPGLFLHTRIVGGDVACCRTHKADAATITSGHELITDLREERRQGAVWSVWSDVQTAVLCVWTRMCSFTMSGCFTPPPCGSSRRSSGSRSRPSAWACRSVRPHVKIPYLGVSDLDASSMYCLDFSLLVHTLSCL